MNPDRVAFIGVYETVRDGVPAEDSFRLTVGSLLGVPLGSVREPSPATGTPAGVGFGRKPPRWLKPGEEVIIAGSVSDEEAKKRYPQGWKAPKTYIGSCLNRNKPDSDQLGRLRLPKSGMVRAVERGEGMGSPVPDTDCTSEISVLLIRPFTVTSSRKLLAVTG